MTDTQDADGFLQARHIRQRYRVTDMTIHRWLRDERLAFPQPIYIGRLRFWRLADIEAWEQTQGRAA